MFKVSKAVAGCSIALAATFLFTFTWASADTQLVTWDFSSIAVQASSENMSTKMTIGPSSLGVTSSSDNFESGGGYWSQDPVAPSAIGDLTAILSVNDIVLQWTHAVDNVAIDHYVIYRGTDPGFAPAGGDSIKGTTDNTYQDPGAAGAVGTNYFYVVKATDPSRNKAEDSNRAGEFNSGLSNGLK
jgi:hypothetical protein